MTTDRELLELAAKAGGIRIDKSETNGGGVGNDGFCVTGDAMLDWHNNIRWNPLTNDGDALRLAVRLGIGVQSWSRLGLSHAGAETVVKSIVIKELHEGDPSAATRRAIVRAAAEIGKAKE